MMIVLLWTATGVVVMMMILMTTTAAAATPPSLERPALVTEALTRRDAPLYYFGLGSNMLRSKLENRGVNGSNSTSSKIEVLGMQPAVVPGYRLSFNMRGFAPLEPGMGSLEPVTNSSSQPLLAYDKPECHGALVLLTPDNYEKVMASEGVGSNNNNNNTRSSRRRSGYEEIVVTAIPYNTSQPAVQAIALRARPHVRLSRDPSPSARYMKILRLGALELQLDPSYQHFLAQHPVQRVPKWLQKLAIANLIATFAVSSKLRGLSNLQNWFLFRAYVPSVAHPLRRAVADVVMATILLPGAVVGSLILIFLKLAKRPLPPFLERFLQLLDAADEKEEVKAPAADVSAVQ